MSRPLRGAIHAIRQTLSNHGHSPCKAFRSPTAEHLCFGYGFIVSANRPKAYTFLAQLADCVADLISIEAAQPHLDLGVLKDLASKTIVLGVLDRSNNEVESVAILVERTRRALPFVAAERLVPAPDCGMKYLSREAAWGKLRALVEAAAVLRRKFIS